MWYTCNPGPPHDEITYCSTVSYSDGVEGDDPRYGDGRPRRTFYLSPADVFLTWQFSR